jgi:hypothetical protein
VTVTPAEIPKAVNRGRAMGSGLYSDVIREFLASGAKAAKVEIDGKTAKMVYRSLRAASKQFEGVKARQRAGSVYLSREE